MNDKNVEIERKWLMDAYPGLPYEREEVQVQGYLCFAPSAVRIRKTQAAGGETCCLTIKGGGGLARTEVELELAVAQYEALVPLLAAPTARKRLRTYVLPSGHTLECSLVDEGQPGAFYYAEVEFDSEEAAVAFEAPAWFGREVTGQPGYSMAAYCRAKLERPQC